MTEPQTNTTAVAAAAAAVAASKKQEQPDDNPTTNNNPIISFFLNIFHLLPLAKNKPPNKDKPVTVNEEIIIDEPKPTVVTFPKQEFPSLKLETEDSETNTNPIILWQVYAIGGFFVLKWAWTRYNESKGKKKDKKEEPAPPPPPQGNQ